MPSVSVGEPIRAYFPSPFPHSSAPIPLNLLLLSPYKTWVSHVSTWILSLQMGDVTEEILPLDFPLAEALPS